MSLIKNASKNYKFSMPRALVVAFGMGLTLLGFLGFSQDAFATTAMNVDVTSGMTIRILDKTGTYDISSIDLSLVSNPLGAYVSDNFIVEVATSAPRGYTLYMEADYLIDETDESTCTNALVHQSDSSYTVPTLSGNIAQDDFYHSKSDTTGVSSLNRWGWSSDNTTYKPIPECDSNTVVNSTTESTASSRLPVYIAANINMEKPAGIYKNTLTFSAIAEPVPISYTLRFNGNTSDSVTDLPTALTGESTASSYRFTIPDTTPVRSGYEFKGWSTSASGPVVGDSGSGEDGLYVAGDTFTAVADGWDSQVAQLYAIWSYATNFWTISTMQEMTPTICNSVYTPAITNASTTQLKTSASGYTATADGTNQVPQRTLTDSRDGNTYIVRKLADGNCWMASNLQLKMSANTAVVASKNDGSTFSYNPGATCASNGACAINGNTPNTGGYYSWYAATAGQGTASSTGDVDGSICPAGWKLPYNYTIDNSKSYRGLVDKYSATSYSVLEATPLSFSRSGYYYSGSLSNSGTDGYYWPSTAIGVANASPLYYNTSVVYPQYGVSKYYGYSVRCVAL